MTSSLLEAALKVKTAVEKTSTPSTPAKVTQTVGRGPGNKGKTYPASPPSPDDMRAILDATHHPDMKLSRKLGLLGLRNRALFVCLWRSGLRIHEALLLTPDDLDFEHCTVTVRRGKGGKRRIVGIDRHALVEINAPLEVGPDICPDCGGLWSHTMACAGTRLDERDRYRKALERIAQDQSLHFSRPDIHEIAMEALS